LTGRQRLIGRSLLAVAAGLATVSGAVAATPRPGSLDERFGDDGRLTGQIGCVPLAVAGIERQSGGGFRVIGSTERSSPELAGESGRLVVRGYDRRGHLDRDVGGTGTVLVALPGGRARAWGVTRQLDGKLVVVGSVGDDFPDPEQDLFVARFYPDGSLDPEFGNGGVVTTDLGALSEEAGEEVLVQPDGRIVVAASPRFESASAYVSPSTELVVLRYLSDGKLDPGFAAGGVLHVPSAHGGIGSAYFGVAGVGLARDGTIFVGGQTGLSYREGNIPTIARVRGDGSLDRMVYLLGAFDGVRAMSFDRTRRRIYLAGNTSRPRDAAKQAMQVAAVREDDLALDTRFGAQGFAQADFPKTDYEFAAAVISDRRGRVVLAGAAGTNQQGARPVRAPRSRFAVARFTTAGKLDRRFGRRGIARVGFPYAQSIAFDVLEQPVGRLVLAGIGAGTEFQPSAGCALAVARLAAR
jgi:uncharacterized delta-60 repeat protein